MDICKICNKTFDRLTATHLRSHNTTFEEYSKKYIQNQNTSTILEEAPETKQKIIVLNRDLIKNNNKKNKQLLLENAKRNSEILSDLKFENDYLLRRV